MSTELILTLIKLLNAIFCLFLIALSLWHNAIIKTHSNTFIVLSIVLLMLLIGQTIYTSSYEVISVLLSLLIILILLLEYYKLKTVKQLSNTANHSDDSINQIREQERSRIYANLHDDVGAKLLELIYTAKDDESKKLAKQVLSDIRQAVASTINVQCSVNQLANEITEETEKRLTSASIELLKSNHLSNPNQHITASIPAVISRICREVISNIIKHSQASQVKISINSTDKNLSLTITDNGKGFSKADKLGKGLKTINKRAQSISSVVKWNTQPNNGTKFSLVYNYGNH